MCENDEQYISHKECWTPQRKPVKAEGSEVRVDAEQLCTEDSDEQQSETSFTGSWPVHVKPLPGRQKDVNQMPAAQAGVEVHDGDLTVTFIGVTCAPLILSWFKE